MRKQKGIQLQGLSPPDPPQGALPPWTPLEALPPDPRYRLALRARHGSHYVLCVTASNAVVVCCVSLLLLTD